MDYPHPPVGMHCAMTSFNVRGRKSGSTHLQSRTRSNFKIVVNFFFNHGSPKMSRNIEKPVQTWQRTSRVHLLSALVTTYSMAPKALSEGMVVWANSLCMMDRDTTTEIPYICFFISCASRKNSKMFDLQQSMKLATAFTKTSNSVF